MSAGDFSGDSVGALLMQKLKSRLPGVTFAAVGGERIEAAGAEMLEDSSDWSAMGIFDALKKVPGIYAALRRTARRVKKMRPDGIVFIDCPAFNLRLAQSLRPAAFPSVYFFPPSPWTGNLARAAKIGKIVDKVISPFAPAAELYRRAGVPTFYCGHPALDAARKSSDLPALFASLGLNQGKPVIGLFPGSRDHEIKYLLPVLLKTGEKIAGKFPLAQFILPAARKSLEPEISAWAAKSNLPVIVVSGKSHEVMQCSDLLLLCSGTATLEAALYEKPMVIIYKVSPLTWKLERPFLKGVRFAGLPNLLSGEEIVPELIQGDLTADSLFQKAVGLLKDEGTRRAMIEDLRKIRGKLGEPGAMDRAADEILKAFDG